MDEYTFIAEDHQAVAQIENTPAVQTVSAEQLYKNELVQELQVMSWHKHRVIHAPVPVLQCTTCHLQCCVSNAHSLGVVCCFAPDQVWLL